MMFSLPIARDLGVLVSHVDVAARPPREPDHRSRRAVKVRIHPATASVVMVTRLASSVSGLVQPNSIDHRAATRRNNAAGRSGLEVTGFRAAASALASTVNAVPWVVGSLGSVVSSVVRLVRCFGKVVSVHARVVSCRGREVW